MARRPTAAIFDLDRTLISESSTPFFAQHLTEEGLLDGSPIPFGDVLRRIFGVFGESRLLMEPARLAVRAVKGWSPEAVERASRAAAKDLIEHVQPFAPDLIEEHRAAGRLLLLATTSPDAFVRPLAEEMGFDDVIATRWLEDTAGFTGEIDGQFIWNTNKRDAVRDWAEEHNIDLAKSYAYSDSYFDAPMLDLVGHPVAVNPDLRLSALATIKGWPIRHLDKTDGVIKIAGREIQEWTRPLMRPEIVAPYADIEMIDVEKIPAEGPAILVFNHRSYFDATVMGLVIAKAGRNIRGLGKKEVFDVPIVGRLMRGLGGVRVERASGSDEPLEEAAKALRGGDIVMLAPEGTIPRGPAFFDPELKGRWGAAKLAADTRVPVIPVGLWGTELVWPRSSRLPRLTPVDRPHVTARVGDPIDLKYRSPDADTKRIMAALVDLLPDEARVQRTPTVDELMMTFPPGYSGDPMAEATRRPGTDT
ncbi:MAG: HAD-IB family hydrolase [Ilumatobacter sp.]|nr:HAD-IB family hydrolase [Ilumatobacter sp.]